MKFLLSLAFLAIAKAEVEVEIPYGSVAHVEASEHTGVTFGQGGCPCWNDGHVDQVTFVNFAAGVQSCGGSHPDVYAICSETVGWCGLVTKVEGVPFCAVGNAVDTLTKEEITEAEYDTCKELVVERCTEIDQPWIE